MTVLPLPSSGAVIHRLNYVYVGAFRDTRVPADLHDPLHIGIGCGGGSGWSFRNLTRIGSRVSLGQNFGEPISLRHEAFQYTPPPFGDLPAPTAWATAWMSADSG